MKNIFRFLKIVACVVFGLNSISFGMQAPAPAPAAAAAAQASGTADQDLDALQKSLAALKMSDGAPKKLSWFMINEAGKIELVWLDPKQQIELGYKKLDKFIKNVLALDDHCKLAFSDLIKGLYKVEKGVLVRLPLHKNRNLSNGLLTWLVNRIRAIASLHLLEKYADKKAIIGLIEKEVEDFKAVNFCASEQEKKKVAKAISDNKSSVRKLVSDALNLLVPIKNFCCKNKPITMHSMALVQWLILYALPEGDRLQFMVPYALKTPPATVILLVAWSTPPNKKKAPCVIV